MMTWCKGCREEDIEMRVGYLSVSICKVLFHRFLEYQPISFHIINL